jgi:hypothetical protein
MAKRVTEDEALEFKRLYVEEKLSIQEVADKTGWSWETVRRNLHIMGAAVRSQGTRTSSPKSSQRHGMSNHPLYKTWLGMVQRCHQPTHKGYRDYGAKGVAVYEPWRSDPRPFIEYVETNLGLRPVGCTIDRDDPAGNYEPGKISWQPWSVQNRNKRAAKVA